MCQHKYRIHAKIYKNIDLNIIDIYKKNVSSINWSLKLPPKVKMFLWRATLDTLPHYAELFHRKISPSPFCNRCYPSMEETTPHVLLLYCRGSERMMCGQELRSLQHVDASTIVLFLDLVVAPSSFSGWEGLQPCSFRYVAGLGASK